ncbi:MAG TPA: hypothetical protein VNH15_06595 [Elusimicrobiota bacterium]|nr:hypothetical protein [Elusimicrobiota bacterium]
MKTWLALPFSLLFAATPLAAQNTSGDAAFSAQLAGIAASPSLRQSATAFKMAARTSAPTTYPKYKDFVFSQIISKRRLTRALQSMVAAAYGVGFRTLGDPDDFFHGHFIFDGKSPRPRFILWHTQERANLYHLYAPGSPKDYVNKARRNWITWLDNDKTEDAAPYRYDSPGPQWCAEVEAYTILPGMMDPAKLGFAPTTISQYYQFDFYKTVCDGRQKRADSSVISVKEPGRGRVCLEFSTDPKKAYSKNFFKFAGMLGADNKKGKNLSRCP